MSQFLSPLIVEKFVDSDDQWKVMQTFEYDSDIGGLLAVPVGFVTDFASTPRIVWTVFPKDGRWDGAALVHDFLYKNHTFDRAKCDAIFLEALGVLKVPFYQRFPMFWAVRAAGWAFWK